MDENMQIGGKHRDQGGDRDGRREPGNGEIAMEGASAIVERTAPQSKERARSFSPLFFASAKGDGQGRRAGETGLGGGGWREHHGGRYTMTGE